MLMLMSKMVVVRKMLVGCADFNAQNADGRIALMLAAHNGHFEVVKVLLDIGAAIPRD